VSKRKAAQPTQGPGLMVRLGTRLRAWLQGLLPAWAAGALVGAGGDGIPVRLSSRSYGRQRGASVHVTGFDQPLLWVVFALMAWGLVMVYSASIALPDNPRFENYAHTHFVLRHGLSMAIGFVAALLAFQVPMRRWEQLAPWLFALALLLMVAVLGIGKGVNGAHRWISLGVMNFQPSELGKLAVLLYAASYMVRKMEIKQNFWQAVWPMAVALLVVGMLLLAQPDMGAFMVIVVIAMGILFLGGVNARMFFLIALVVVGAFAMMIMASDWRRERIFAYLDPWSAEHALGKGYQLSHALIAFGRGEIFGVGLGGSVEKLNWLPEAHTDFLLAVIGEEFGLLGVLVLIALFLWMIRRIMHIGRQAIALDQVFSGLVAQGVGLWMGFQAFINIGVNLGALPTKGLTLPFMSYGGSAILLNLIALAIVLRVDFENRQMMKGGRA
jgi:cell division protein FtsW